MKKLINKWLKSEAYTEYCNNISRRKLNKRIDSNGIQSVLLLYKHH